MPELGTLAVTAGAAFVAGALNAVAGGGSFLTLPALVWAGLPPVMANATGTAALLPGYITSAWGLGDDVRQPATGAALPLRWPALAALCALGGAAGAALLLVVGNGVFTRLVPWLLLVATALFAAAPWVLARLHAGAPTRWRSALMVLAVSAYGGFFNGGLGIVLLAALGLLGMTQLGAMNALKNAASALLTAIAVVVYAVGGVLHWPWALGLAACAAAGGYLGARLARHIPPAWLRAGIVATGLVMARLMWP